MHDRIRTFLRRSLCSSSPQKIYVYIYNSDCLLGRAVPASGWTRCVQLAQLGLSELTTSFGMRAPVGRELAQQVPRSDDAAAVQAANRALDRGNFRELCLPSFRSLLDEIVSCSWQHRDIGLLFAFDGASRGNPGLASLGVSAWWGTWIFDEFREGGVIFRCGRRLGKTTNNARQRHTT